MPQARLRIRVASDGLSAYVTVAAGPAIERAEFDAELRAEGVRRGICMETYQRIAESLGDATFHCSEELLAVGYPAQPGQDAWFEPGFSPGLQAGHLRSDGSVDYHDRELLKSIGKGEVLGVVRPAVPAIAGERVDATPIPVPRARELTLQLGSGVELGADLLVRAARDGVILYKAGQSLDVVDQHVHQGKVDLHSGNLNMQGSLVVRGDVLRPFSVAATGDIEILGNVESASVRAGGTLRVRAGVRGGEGGVVSADGNLMLHHAESAELHCGGLLQLSEAVNSRLVASKIHVSGHLRAGVAVAESEILVREAGAPHGVETSLLAGEPLELPVAEAQRVIAALKAERTSMRAGGRNNERNKGGKVGRAKAELDTREVQRLAERAKRREELASAAYVQVGMAHPGVSIRIGGAHLTLEAPVNSTRFSLDRTSQTIRVEGKAS